MGYIWLIRTYTFLIHIKCIHSALLVGGLMILLCLYLFLLAMTVVLLMPCYRHRRYSLLCFQYNICIWWYLFIMIRFSDFNGIFFQISDQYYNFPFLLDHVQKTSMFKPPLKRLWLEFLSCYPFRMKIRNICMVKRVIRILLDWRFVVLVQNAKIFWLFCR